MSKLTFNNNAYDLEQYESVLDCLLRNGQAIPYACKAGMCQACLIRAVDCQATDESRKWIKPALQTKGFTLACQWVPQNDVSAELPSVEDFSVTATIAELHQLNAQVLRVRLCVPDPSRMFSSRPGQYLTLINPHGVARSYSIANDYECDGYLELHIGSTEHGLFSNWVFNEAAVGDLLHMRGASGECYYLPGDAADSPLLLAGIGTGLAPLYGIVRDALNTGHSQPISLYHGGRTSAQLYYTEELRQLATKHPNFLYFPCTKDEEKKSLAITGTLENILEANLDVAALPKTRVYLCGAPGFVHGLRKAIYLKGAKAAHIHCDPFTERQVVTSTDATDATTD